jgi:hypothetical protein
MAGLPDPTQRVVALDVGLQFCAQRQRLWRIHGGRARWFTVHQAVQQVEDMGLGWGACRQSQFDGGEHRLFVVLKD